MKKGISQLIGSALLIAIAVSMTAVYTQFAQDLSRESTTKVVEDSRDDLRCKNAGLDISDPVYYRVRSDVNFTVSNTGTIRYSQPINTAVIADNGSVVERKKLEEFTVSESRNIVINVENPPERIIATSRGCPSVSSEENVEVTTSG